MTERFKVKHYANLPYSDMPGYTRMIEAYRINYTAGGDAYDRWAGSINEVIVSGQAHRETNILISEKWVDADSAYLACRRYIKWLESGEGQLMDVEGGC